MHVCQASRTHASLGLTFAKVTDVLRELQMCTAQGGREQADRLLEGRVEAGHAIKHRVSQKLCRGRPKGQHQDTVIQRAKCLQTSSAFKVVRMEYSIYSTFRH